MPPAGTVASFTATRRCPGSTLLWWGLAWSLWQESTMPTPGPRRTPDPFCTPPSSRRSSQGETCRPTGT
eukprot:scaffold22062_cov101-Isochrysis_galbana.AAC.2